MASPYITDFAIAPSFDLDDATLTLTDISTYVDSSQVQGICFALYAPDGVALNEPFYNNTNFATPDITPSAAVPFVVNLPSFSGQPQWGTYKMVATAQDADGNQDSVTITFTLCAPTSCDGTETQLPKPCVSLTNNCSAGKVEYRDRTTYIYNDVAKSSITYDVSVTPPQGSAYTGGQGFFTMPLVDGVWSYAVTNTVTYEFDDNVSVVVTYHTTGKHDCACSVDLCQLRCAINAYKDQYEAVASKGNAQAVEYATNMMRLAVLYGLIDLALQCGSDTSAYVDEVKDITGLDCSCDCTSVPNQGASLDASQEIILTTDCGDIDISSSQVGFTTTFTINGKAVTVTSESGSGVTVSLVETDCTKTFTIAVTPDNAPVGNAYTVELASDTGTPMADVVVNEGDPLRTLLAALVTGVTNASNFNEQAIIAIANNSSAITALQEAPSWEAISLDTAQFNGVALSPALRVSKSVQGNVWLHGMVKVVNTNIAAGTTVALNGSAMSTDYWPDTVNMTWASVTSGSSGAGVAYTITVAPTGLIYVTATAGAAVNINQFLAIDMHWPTN